MVESDDGTSHTGELFFEDCKVPVENGLGEDGEGFVHIMRTSDGSA
ncbi:MAG: hypothetical protein ABR552_04980 [Actinomycetota bacterium]|nr:hypothetical protein [Actinomycetota bacterium]